MPVNKTFAAEVRKAMKALDDFGDEFKDAKKRRSILKPAATILRDEIKQNAPRSEKEHSRYATAKFDKSKRAPKGMGTKVATYQPGNLEESISVLTFRQSPALFVGPKIDKRNKGGVDGYYAHWVEFGTKNMPPHPYVRPAIGSATSKVAKAIEAEVRKEVNKFEQRLK